MKTVALLLLGLAVLATTSLYIVQRSNELVELSDEKSCANFYVWGYMLAEFNKVENTCSDKNVSFTINFKTKNGERQLTTECLKFNQGTIIYDHSEDYKLISYSGQAC